MSNVRIGIRIAELRKRSGYTQNEFAEKLGKSVDTISNYERGKTGLDAIQLVVNMCELLGCDARDLLETFSVPNQNQNLGDVDTTLRVWWRRVFPETRSLGGKEIDEIINNLKNCVESLSDQEIVSIFSPDDDLDERFQFLVSDFESNRSRQYDMGNLPGEIIHNDPDTCAFIFSYLKTRDNRFLNDFNDGSKMRLKRFVKDNAKSGSPSYLAQKMASSDFLN